MSRLWDVVIGGGIVVCLLALVGCCVQAVLEVLAVERDRRKVAGRGQSEGARHAIPARTAPPSGVVDPVSTTWSEITGPNDDGSFTIDFVYRAEVVDGSDAAARVVAELEGRA